MGTDNYLNCLNGCFGLPENDESIDFSVGSDEIDLYFWDKASENSQLSPLYSEESNRPNDIICNTLPHWLTILTQPRPYSIFSYMSDIGKIPSKIVKISLKPTLEKYKANVEYVVMCQLYEPSRDAKLSPHHLIDPNDNTQDVVDTNTKSYYEPIFKPIVQNSNNGIDLEFYIVQTKPSDEERSLIYKYRNMLNKGLLNREPTMDEIKNRARHECLQRKQNRQADSMCIGLTVYSKSNNIYTYIDGPIYSEPIFNQQLVIRKICNAHGSVNGGTKVILLLTIAVQKDIKVKMWNAGWESYIQNIVYNDSGIEFETPKYEGKCSDEAICHVQIAHVNDNWKSKKVKFVYTTYEKLEGAKKPRTTSPVSQNKTEKPRKLVSDYVDSQQYPESSHHHKAQCSDAQVQRYTDYHDAISKGNFISICKNPTLPAQEKIRTEINEEGENLLHYACKLNKHVLIRPLIGFRCSIIAQDTNGNTPLHIAIEKRQYSCIEKFRELYSNLTGFKHLTTEFPKLFKIYNSGGFTVLHLAIIYDLKDLVADMLKFCKNLRIDICSIEVLGTGQTILHLAEYKPLMANIILKHFPKADRYKNYEGRTANLSDEMDELSEMYANMYYEEERRLWNV